MGEVKKHDTPMVDELKKGPWPSFVDDIYTYGEKHQKQSSFDLMGQLELSYQHKETHWKHGGIVGVLVTEEELLGVILTSRKGFLRYGHFILFVFIIQQESGIIQRL